MCIKSDSVVARMARDERIKLRALSEVRNRRGKGTKLNDSR